jgi:hypothetical protein
MHSTVNSAPRGLSPGRALGLLAALAAAFLFLSSILAQPAAAQQAAPGAYSEQDLEAFAAAALKVEELNEKWIPQIAEAKTADENAAMRERAMEEMREAVKEEGLTVEEYNGIYDAAQRDPEVMKTIEEHRDSLR